MEAQLSRIKKENNRKEFERNDTNGQQYVSALLHEKIAAKFNSRKADMFLRK
jgi:hypothetical protein